MTDNQNKRFLTLENGLKVVLVSNHPEANDREETQMSDQDEDSSDPEVEEDENCSGSEAENNSEQEEDEDGCSCAALIVGAGTFSDPPDIPGLAHLIEHTLFLGSEKFPKLSEFDKLIKNNEGNNNGQTCLDVTTYGFEVHTKLLDFALEQFASMITSPLFDRDRIKQEIQIVDAELTLQHRNEKMRHDYLLTQMAKDGHPMGRFSWGNAATLETNPQKKGINVYLELEEFFRKHYVAERMTLGIISSKSLDALEKLVRRHFSELPRGTSDAGQYTGICGKDEMPFDMKKFHKFYKVTAPAYNHTLYVSWVLPGGPVRLSKGRPFSFIVWVLSHEGPGCLGDILIKKRYATGILVRDENYDLYFPAVAYFSVAISLTSLGVEHASEVIKHLFQYINFFKGLGPEEMEELWKRMRRQEKLSEQWPISPLDSDYIKDLALELYRTEDSKQKPTDPEKVTFQLESIQTNLNLLTADTMNVTLFSPSFQSCSQDKYDPWFKMYYSEEPLPQDLMNILKNISTNECELQLPRKNPFISSKLCAKAKKGVSRGSSKQPCKIDKMNSKWPYVLYFRGGSDSESLKAYLYFYLKNDVLNSTVQQACITDIYVRALDIYLNDTSFEAELAMLTWLIDTCDNGIVIHFIGFADKLGSFVQEIITKIAEFEIEQSLFTMSVEYVKTCYQNILARPETLVDEMRQSHLNNQHWSTDCKLAQIELVTIDSFCKIKQTIQKFSTVECLMQGNLSRDEAISCADFVVQALGVTRCYDDDAMECDPACNIIRMLKVGDYQISRLNYPGDDNMKIQNYYQIFDTDSNLSRKTISLSDTMMELLVRMMDEPCETFLRSRCAVGYTIDVVALHDDPAHGLAITAQSQSSKFTASNVEHYIDLYIEEFLTDHIQSMTKEKFIHFVNITKDSLSGEGLCKEATTNWAEILKGTYNFKKLSQQVSQLEQLNMNDFKKWAFDFLSEDSGIRRKLSIQVIGQEQLEPDNGDATNRGKNGETNILSKVQKLAPICNFLSTALKLDTSSTQAD